MSGAVKGCDCHTLCLCDFFSSSFKQTHTPLSSRVPVIPWVLMHTIPMFLWPTVNHLVTYVDAFFKHIEHLHKYKDVTISNITLWEQANFFRQGHSLEETVLEYSIQGSLRASPSMSLDLGVFIFVFF